MYMNTQQPTRLWKILVYGPSGVGKTHLGCTAPDPVILLAERQGFETVRDAAQRLGKPLPPTFWMRTRTDFGEALKMLQGPEPIRTMAAHFAPGEQVQLPYTQPQTVVIDSVTEMMQLVWDHLMDQAPPKTASDGLPDMSMRHWTAMRDRSGALIRACRDLPYHVLLLAGIDDREVGEEDQKERQVTPACPMRSIPALLAHACNGVGVQKIRRRWIADAKAEGGRREETERYVQFLAPSFVLAKPLSPLRGEENVDASDWFRRLGGGAEAEQTRAAPSAPKAPKRRGPPPRRKPTNGPIERDGGMDAQIAESDPDPAQDGEG